MKFLAVVISLLTTITVARAEDGASGTFPLASTSLYSFNVSPSLMIAGSKITIKADGTVILGKGITLDEASVLFWKAMQDAGMKLVCPQKQE